MKIITRRKQNEAIRCLEDAAVCLFPLSRNFLPSEDKTTAENKADLYESILYNLYDAVEILSDIYEGYDWLDRVVNRLETMEEVHGKVQKKDAGS
jgi:hypothetical protein